MTREEAKELTDDLVDKIYDATGEQNQIVRIPISEEDIEGFKDLQTLPEGDTIDWVFKDQNNKSVAIVFYKDDTYD